jgi:nucleoid DNA-binding protein
MPLVRAESIVNTIFDSIEASLKKGERTEIRGFGSFEVRAYGEYAGRNPRSGTTVLVKAKRLPFFKTGKELKDRINASAHLKNTARRGPLAAPSLPVISASGSASGAASGLVSQPTSAVPSVAAAVASTDEAASLSSYSRAVAR